MLRPSRILDPALEVQDEPARAGYLAVRLRETVAHAYESSRHFRREMDEAHVRPADVQSVDDLPRVPITRKDDVPALQAADPPFGGLLGVDPARLQRIFASPG